MKLRPRVQRNPWTALLHLHDGNGNFIVVEGYGQKNVFFDLPGIRSGQIRLGPEKSVVLVAKMFTGIALSFDNIDLFYSAQDPNGNMVNLYQNIVATPEIASLFDKKTPNGSYQSMAHDEVDLRSSRLNNEHSMVLDKARIAPYTEKTRLVLIHSANHCVSRPRNYAAKPL